MKFDELYSALLREGFSREAGFEWKNIPDTVVACGIYTEYLVFEQSNVPVTSITCRTGHDLIVANDAPNYATTVLGTLEQDIGMARRNLRMTGSVMGRDRQSGRF